MGRICRVLTTILFLGSACAAAAEGPPADSAGVEFFEKRIRPILAENCYQCHGTKKQESGLLLNSAAGIHKGGDRGPPLVSGQPDESILIQAVRYGSDDLKMPPRGKLKEVQIADLVAWVKMGAPFPIEGSVQSAAIKPSSDFNLAERAKHWAYQPVQRAALPVVNNPAWCASAIDAFILSKLEAMSLSPTPAADRRVLIRRLTFDLTGLPPTPSEAAAFLANDSPDAYERLVDRLLASPQYGERWARHWLDVVRYSETLGFEFDYDLYHAWRYRDYVIRAFNADLPYDQFVVEHLAGDRLPEPRNATEGVPYRARQNAFDGCNESILATGFFWMLEGKQTPVDIRQEQADRIDNQLDTLGKAFLGQTIACARCHDHKFDAISTRDYYALAGYLKSSRFQQAFIDSPDKNAAVLAELAALRRQIDERCRQRLAEQWRAELSRASQYLLAAASSDSEKMGKELGLDSPRLNRWVKALQQEEPTRPDHPLYTWTTMAKNPSLSAAQLQNDLAEQREKANRLAAAARAFDEFRLPGFGGCFATGQAFGQEPAGVGEAVIGDSPLRPIARLTTGGADSGLISLRLQGELRSPTFTIDKKYVHLRLSGSKARMNLVIDGYTLIMNPIYGKLTAAPASSVLTWRTMPVDRWLGHRAYFEVSDDTIPMHGLNPPPSTARVPESKGDGYVVLDQIVFSDDADPPATPNLLSYKVVGSQTPAQRATHFQQLMLDQVSRWQSGDLASAADGSDGIALINWLLENGLLENDGPAPDEDLTRLLTRFHDLQSTIQPPQRAPALADGSGEDEFVFLRGNYRTLGEQARRGPPEVLDRCRSRPPGGTSDDTVSNQKSGPAGPAVPTSGRLELAERLVDPANPLLPRVIVNRLWQHHFGEGIVRTPDDFGRMGQPPSHPELLDYLAAELIRCDWSLKDISRRMVTASTYRQSSNTECGMRSEESPETIAPTPHSEFRTPHSIDPDNRLLWHMPLRRLEAEAVRDSILAASGRLDLRMHGPSVLPYVTPYMEGRGKPNTGPLDAAGRRSIYINARRNFLTPLLLAFDYPVTFTPIGRRGTSAIPAQALTLMNDPFVVQQANEWAGRVLAEGGSSTEQKIEALYQSAFARPPSEQETRDAIDFLQQQSLRHSAGSDDPRVWTDLCHVLMNVKEFIFIE